MKNINDSNIIVLDGPQKTPLFVRFLLIFPILGSGLLIMNAILERFFKVVIFTTNHVQTKAMTIPALLFVFILNLVFISFWFDHKILYYDSSQKLIIGEGRFLFIKWKKRTPVNQLLSINYEHSQIKSSTFFNVYLSLKDERKIWLSRHYNEEEAKDFCQKISESTGKLITTT